MFSDYLIDFLGPFSWGAKMAFFGLGNALSGISGFRVLYGVGTIAILGVMVSSGMVHSLGLFSDGLLEYVLFLVPVL